MALSKYTNVDEINARNTGTGQFLEKEDLFIISQNASEKTRFGDCDTDVMEVTLYDVNNNILPQNDNKTIKYIGYGEIGKYLLKTSTQEIAIDIEKLLNDSGYKSGIIKVNINFVRLKAGNETEFRKMWIQEISATRSEVRILPLEVQESPETTQQNETDFNNLQELNVDSYTYKQHLTKILNLPNSDIKFKIRQYVEKKFSIVTAFPYYEFARILYVDFGLSEYDNTSVELAFEKFIEKIVTSFKEKIQNKINSLNTSECEYVSNKELDRELLTYLTTAFNEEASKLRTGDIFTRIEIANETEQLAETIFEAGKQINTDSIAKVVEEYSTIDLSSVKLNSENLDTFTAIQQRVEQVINEQTRETVETTVEQAPAIVESGGGAAFTRYQTDPYNQDIVFGSLYDAANRIR